MSSRRKTIDVGGGVSIEVISERRNSLVKRLELECVINHIGRGTPSRSEIRKAISRRYNKPVDNIHIRKIAPLYGYGRSVARINIYDDPSRAALFEPGYILKRDSR